MQPEEKKLWENRIKRLKGENESLKERLASQKEKDNELRKSLGNMRKMFDTTPAAIVLIQEEKIIDINQSALNQLGYTAKKVIGRNFHHFLHPDSKMEVASRYFKRISGKFVPNEYETALITESGETVICDVWIGKIRIYGKNALLVGLNRIEKRKEREKKILHTKKIEALNTMSAGLNRELSSSIKIITENIEKSISLSEQDDKNFRKHLKRIEIASDRVSRIIQNLGNISGVEIDSSNKEFFDLKNIVGDVVERTVSKWEKDADPRGERINLKTYLRPVSQVRGVPYEIRDMITNIILNAVEAMPDGGDIYITTEENAGYAHVYIQDSGVGISDNIKDRIFDPFFTTKGKDGMGIGLSLANAVIKRHNGKIDIMSQGSQGTMIDIQFPIFRPGSVLKHEKQKNRIRNANILIIEDDNIIAELLSKLLVSKGHRITEAVTAPEGLKKLKKKKYDLVIVDHKILTANRQNIIQQIKKVDDKFLVALISDQKADSEHKNIKNSGVDLMINKPVDLNIAVKQISEILMVRH